MSLLPGKGFHGDLTSETLNFFQQCFEDIWNTIGDDPESLDAAIDEREQKPLMDFLRELHGSAAGWKQAKDKFGIKLYKAMPYGEGENRVTVVINSRNELKIDIRHWFDPSA
jgi:hypothetical protein